MKKSKLNLWPLLPIAILAAAFLAAHLMPSAEAEKNEPEESGVSATP